MDYFGKALTVRDVTDHVTSLSEEETDKSLIHGMPVYSPRGYISLLGSFDFSTDIVGSIVYIKDDIVHVLDMTLATDTHKYTLQTTYAEAWQEGIQCPH